ncbi:Concanavalin A-like lectin/glucanases superfamily [Penicillium chermesinum]|uniref:Concanavalin A-like lectin/glucanases superfamily n=1 Tax=Penicillium chermesinum TaxID=63820 RepID=A0A9W9NRV7_9EURO|nr:Concanavalin A-like lectin/glucanases superfamily [Penicillium chermesinum]KAJ5224954.1 Concanavalin A-like lectin/glucanases superfamily [Penicillium chermesinum]KAJ6151686.1 Concanavalin A-like lectin/glucanases superfamily [Penicillium chermesinum]
MKFTTAITTAILATGAFAAPRPGLVERLQSRGVLSRQSAPADKAGADHPLEEKGVLEKGGHDGAQVQYSNNWAGIVRENPPASATYTAVSATFTVPNPTATDNSGNMQAASAWVGIDGDTYTNAILQTGVDCYIQDGQKSYDAWYEWFPNSAQNFDLDLTAGDVIVATVQSSSPSEGVAMIENKSTGQKVTKSLSAPSSTATLGGQNAEWIVEDFNSGNAMVPLVNFGKVTFTGAQAEADGEDYGVQSSAQVLDIQQNGKILAKTTVLSDTEFSVAYSG